MIQQSYALVQTCSVWIKIVHREWDRSREIKILKKAAQEPSAG